MSAIIYIKDANRHIAPDGSKQRMCHYLCFCGKEFIALKKNVDRGNTTSCGCHRTKRAGIINLSHGLTVGRIKPPELVSWDNMMNRCYSKSHPDYKNYGGRGIIVCKRWHKFENFYLDMGKKPTKNHSIDRFPDNNGIYKKSNCRWATMYQQASNRRNNVWLECDGKKMIQSHWARLFCITTNKLSDMLKRTPFEIIYKNYIQ